MVYVRHDHWLTGNLSLPLRMIGKVSIVVVPSSVVSLSCANAAGVAIGGASDITGNAGTIIVGSYRTVRASVSDGTCFRIGRYASATVISALLNGVSVRLFGVPLCVDVNMENTVNMHLFSNCLKKTIQKFCLFYISLYICRVIHFSVPSDRMCYTDLLSASQRRSPQWVGREMPMRGVLIVVNII